MVDENSKTPNRNNQKLNSETVMVAIVGGPELHVDQVDCGIRTTDVDHLGEPHRTAHHCRYCGEIVGAT